MQARQVRQVVAAAQRVRRACGVSSTGPVCPITLAQKLGLSVRYVSAASLEGLYHPGDKPLVILGSQRPWGRRNYTCAHEIGHHMFGHGTRVDEVPEQGGRRGWDPEEYVADRFASALLMPKLAVLEAFTRRGMNYLDPLPSDVAVVAEELGVGYTTLIGCMERTLDLLSPERAKALRRQTPLSLREEILGGFKTDRLVPVDQHWRRQTVDLEVGNVVQLPEGSEVDDNRLAPGPVQDTYVAHSAGIVGVRLPGRTTKIQIRLSRQRFHGLAQYRFMEDDSGE